MTEETAIPDEISASASIARVAKLRDQLIGFTESLAAKSRGSLSAVYAVMAVNVFALSVFLVYFIIVRGYSWLWTPLPLIVIALPTVVIWIYKKILSQVAELPNQIAQTADEAIDAISEYSGELVELSKTGLSLIRRWRSYVLLGKVLWKIRGVTGDAEGIFMAIKLMALMVNPLFWLILLISLIVSVVVSAMMMLSCILHAFFF